MNDNSNPSRRGQLRAPVSVACCRWTPINFAEIASGTTATLPDPDQERETPGAAVPATAVAVLIEKP
jgi:hypothetical protein